MPAYDTEGGGARERRHTVVAAFFLVLAGVAVYLPPEAQESVASALRGSVLHPFVATQRGLADVRMRMGRMEELQAQLDSAVAALSAHSTLADENRQLRALLELRQSTGPDFVPATVIRPGTRGSESMLLLDVGSGQGVSVNDPVVAADGLVGIVREVRPNSALAMDWTHPDFRVSAMSLEGEVFGIVEPRHGRFREEDRLILSGTPFHAELADAAPVVTSGRGSVYPRGIPVGVVHSLAEAEAGWRKSYWIDPAVRPAGVTHVLVMTGEAAVPGADLSTVWAERGEAGGAEEQPPTGSGGASETGGNGGGRGSGSADGERRADGADSGAGEPGGGG